MLLLVTGGFGFIGSQFIRKMLMSDPEVQIVNVDKMGLGSNPDNLKDYENNENYSFFKRDISKDDIYDLIGEVDAVVNFAAETHVDRSIADPKPFVDSNILGVFNLLEAERKSPKPVKHVQVSTDEVYGDISKGSFSETDVLKPSNPYSATKAAADMLCHAYHRTYGLDVRVTRCTNNFGPYQFPEKLIPKTIIRAQRDMQIPIYGTGENIRDWLYVEDHCEAISRVLKEGRSGEIYNVSSSNEVSTLDIVNVILEYMGKPKTLKSFVEDRPGHDFRYSLDSSKIRKELGWKPAYYNEEALHRTIDWYIENDWWWKPLINEKILSPTPWKLN